MSARYAIYFAPPPDSALARFGAAWLGAAEPRPSINGISAERLAEITAAPRHYGFHATLKPPFALADGCDETALSDAFDAFTAARRGFTAPRLRVAPLSGFVALTLSAPCPDMDVLAADCVRTFDKFRAVAGPDELAKRRAAGLTARQEELLRTWGYPYVMQEFRFHMTLSQRLNAADRTPIIAALELLATDVTGAPLDVDGIAVFRQPDRDSPFEMLRRYRFGA